jgi:hypothetical protein
MSIHTCSYYCERPECIRAQRDELRQKLEQAEKQEPVAWFTDDHREDKSATTYSKRMAERWKEKGWPVTPLYTAPVHASDISQERVDETAKRKDEWVGFAHEELAWLNEALNLGGRFAVIEAIEAKLKEKNHDTR